jgi:diguanylate cyclase (GGDEF)-like protein
LSDVVRVLNQLQARHEDSARRSAVAMCLVVAVVALGAAIVDPAPDALRQALVLANPAALVLLAGFMSVPYAQVRKTALTVTPFLAVGLVLGLDLLTNDASAAAQVSFCLPVLLVSYHYRPLAAVLVALLALAGEAFLVLTLRPGLEGTMDVVFMTLVLGLMTGVLVISGVRQDRLVAMLQQQAGLDALTGLVSRRVLDDATRRALERNREPGTALLIIDVDHFKIVNDTYGHLVGDDALIHVGALLGPVSASETAVVARMGGDELALLLPGCSLDEAVRTAEEFVRRVRASPVPRTDGAPVSVTVSVGVAHAVSSSTPPEIYGAADSSLYAAKRAGRDGVGPSVTLPPASPVPSQRGADGPVEMDDVVDRVRPRDRGVPGDDRLDHR